MFRLKTGEFREKLDLLSKSTELQLVCSKLRNILNLTNEFLDCLCNGKLSVTTRKMTYG